MNTTSLLCSAVTALFLLGTLGCGSSSSRELAEALDLEEKVGQEFGKLIAAKGHAGQTVLVLTTPEPGPRVLSLEARRLSGLRKGLPGVSVLEVPAGSPGDERLMMMLNDHLPMALLSEVLAAHPQASAVVSLVGYPYLDAPEPLAVPLYVFGLSHQALGRNALESGMAVAVMYSRGASDEPLMNASSIPADVLQSYSVEVR